MYVRVAHPKTVIRRPRGTVNVSLAHNGNTLVATLSTEPQVVPLVDTEGGSLPHCTHVHAGKDSGAVTQALREGCTAAVVHTTLYDISSLPTVHLTVPHLGALSVALERAEAAAR